MEDEIKRADEQIPDLKADDDKAEDLIPAINYRPEEKVSHCGTCAIRGGKLHAYDWLDDLPTPPNASDLVEVQFKNTRKAYYRNSTGLQLKMGDTVAVESSPGHDIGTVTLQGRLVYLQMHKNHVNPQNYEFKRIYRIARPTDIEKWEEAKGLEHETMLEARKIAQDLHLNMKIGDVEYQGDRTKAIFYYIADERVDFRELIKVLADRFRVRIEMRQIGARQEAGRIGGIGPCGREMCCATWMTSFISVSTHSARVQDLSLNPVKLAGQCGKLKCCLNYELASYIDAIRSFPPTDKPLETADGTYYFFKYDIFKRIMWYSPQKDSPSNIVAVDADHVAEIQRMNAEGKKPDDIGGKQQTVANEEESYSSVLELDDDLTRFDSKGGKRGNRGGDRRNGGNNRDNRGGQRNGGDRNNSDRNNDNRGDRRSGGNNRDRNNNRDNRGGQRGDNRNRQSDSQQNQQQGQQPSQQQGQQQNQQPTQQQAQPQAEGAQLSQQPNQVQPQPQQNTQQNGQQQRQGGNNNRQGNRQQQGQQGQDGGQQQNRNRGNFNRQGDRRNGNNRGNNNNQRRNDRPNRGPRPEGGNNNNRHEGGNGNNNRQQPDQAGQQQKPKTE